MLFSGKIPFHVAARLTVRFWVSHLLRFATIPHYSRLFFIIPTIRDYSHYLYYSLFGIIRDYSLFGFSRHPLDITNILVVSPQIHYIEFFDKMNPPFNEQIWPVPSDFVKSRFHCSGVSRVQAMKRVRFKL